VTLPCCFAVAPPLPVCFRRRLVWVCVSIEQSCSCLHADRLSRADGLELDAPGYILNRAALAHCLITSIACEVPDRRAEDRLTGRRERALDVIAAVCVVIVATRLLLRALPRQLAAVQLYFADMQVRTLQCPAP